MNLPIKILLSQMHYYYGLEHNFNFMFEIYYHPNTGDRYPVLLFTGNWDEFKPEICRVLQLTNIDFMYFGEYFLKFKCNMAFHFNSQIKCDKIEMKTKSEDYMHSNAIWWLEKILKGKP